MATVIAYGTGRQSYYDLFMASCNRYSIDPVILGWGEKWIGSGKKLIQIGNFLKSLPPDEVVIVVDPFDVVFLSGLREIETKFLHYETPFLCGALKLKGFHESIYELEFNRTKRKVPRTPSAYNYLNAGTWISYAGFASQLIDKFIIKFNMVDTTIDQQVLTGAYITDRYSVDLDWRVELFQNLLFTDFITRRPDMSDLHFVNNRIMNRTTGSMPCILHASGSTRMKKIARKLGYDDKVSIPVNDGVNYFHKVSFHLRKVLQYSLNYG